MRIMVFDVPAENGGALSVLLEFYNKFKLDGENEYIFVLSKAELSETKNIRVLYYPWIKKSWIHRLYFDNFIAPKLIKKNNVDKVFSLQNVIIPHTKIEQTLYVHNAIPFSEYKFKFVENKLLWVYQNIIGKNIFKSIKNANKVIVQTQWMKNKCIDKTKKNPNDIQVMLPKINIEVKNYFIETKESLSTFFYPASGVEFKNHKVIVDACLELKKKNINNYKVLFTLNGNENKGIELLYKIIKENELPIEFIGYISKERVLDYYSKSVLIFPSYIETVGLPLIEASLHKTHILVANCEYAIEILNGYKKALFFNPFDYLGLSQTINQIVNIKYNK
ncbi:glycosyltransferase [Clostridium sp.]|uniref:glycosyltransferase n=1 Tax=Clostridium sp. TaxID=1506 RepID=UPI0029064DC4|nr:glycosyltransferase [Clostridium sp.]MDU5106516.1 glycosyltransferase [Clostridium sp.]